MFYGRETELSKLERLYSSGGFHCAVVYGRRRVGKTTLIGEFCKDKKALFFSALEFTAEENLKVFSRTLNAFLYPESTVSAEYANFGDAFVKVYEAARNERFVFVIDEYPYLAAADKSISSVLQHAIDHQLSKTGIFMILCGSSMSFMENQVLGYKSPLYGRRTAQFRLEPLNYLKSAQGGPGLSPETNAVIYGITGGIPHYINKLNVKSDEGLDEAITMNLLERTSYLFEEPANLLKQELREPSTYNSIIAGIAGGASRLNEIATKTSLEYGICSKYLSVLISLGIAGKKSPAADKTKNRGLYFINDNLFNFWYRFVTGNISLVMADKPALVYKTEVKPHINEYMGRIFEEICRQYLLYVADDLPFIPKETGGWWGGNPETKKQEEIDILAVSGKSAIFGECKWQSAPVDFAVLENLRRKARIFPRFERKYFYLFSKSGFTSGMTDAAGDDASIRLVTLDGLYPKLMSRDRVKGRPHRF